MLQDHPNLQI